MADSAKLRVVRCPKCENLLPELPGYSVYQCGGCGAVLRAKKSDNEGGRVPERSVEARDGVISVKSDILSAKSEDIPAKSASVVEKNEDIPAKSASVASDSNGSNGCEAADTLGNDFKGPVEKLPVENANMGKNKLGNGDVESSVHQPKSLVERANGNGLRISDGFAKQKVLERGAEVDGFGRIRRGDSEGGFRSFKYAGEGTSKYNGNGVDVHRSAALMENECEVSKSNGAERVGPSREELLKKLDELKEQLSKACDVNEKHKEKDPVDARMFGPEPYVDSVNWYPDHSSGFRQGSRQFYAPEEHGIRSNYCDRYHEPYAAPIIRTGMSMNDYHSSTQDFSHVPGYDSPFGSRLYTRSIPRQTACVNSQQPRAHSRMPGHFLGPEPDLFEPHPYNNPALNQFSCSCYQCHHKRPMQIPSATYRRRHPFVPQGCESRIGHPHIGSYDVQPHTRWPSDIINVAGGYMSSRPQRVLLANDGRRCRPMAGGAPFVTCHNCFELLELPKMVPMFDKSQWKIRCGGCSSLISFAMVDEKLIPVDAPPKQTLKDAFDSSDEVLLDRPYDPHGGMRRDNMGFHSEDYDNSGYDFQSMEKEPNSSSDRHGFNSSKSEELRNTHLASCSTSEDEVFAGTEMPVKADLSPPPPGSPLQEHFDHSTKFHAVNRCGKGNLSSRSDQERVLSSKNTVRQNSLKKSLATELDLSLNDYANTGVPHDTADTSGEEDLPKSKKGVDSFFAGIIKKSFRDFSKSSQTAENGKRSVFINGRLIPDRSVKKAEKTAGPVSPGNYWYDFKAGFWGVMGGPCLGIIPPNIEEFSYPMPQNCAGGNTGVIVNGRELHLNDLDLLASRGLPVTTNRSYLIDISGKVIDEDTGQELDCLGKLAPTVEKVRHGFGMRVPKAVS